MDTAVPGDVNEAHQTINFPGADPAESVLLRAELSTSPRHSYVIVMIRT